MDNDRDELKTKCDEHNWLLRQLAEAKAEFDKWPKWKQDQMLFGVEMSSGKG